MNFFIDFGGGFEEIKAMSMTDWVIIAIYPIVLQ